jgi:hypothetical protein
VVDLGEPKVWRDIAVYHGIKADQAKGTLGVERDEVEDSIHVRLSGGSTSVPVTLSPDADAYPINLHDAIAPTEPMQTEHPRRRSESA